MNRNSFWDTTPLPRRKRTKNLPTAFWRRARPFFPPAVDWAAADTFSLPSAEVQASCRSVTIDRRRGEDGWGAAAAAPTPPLSPFGAGVSSSSVAALGSSSAVSLVPNVAVATPAPSPSPLAAHHVKADRYPTPADYGHQRPFMAQPRVSLSFSFLALGSFA